MPRYITLLLRSGRVGLLVIDFPFVSSVQAGIYIYFLFTYNK